MGESTKIVEKSVYLQKNVEWIVATIQYCSNVHVFGNRIKLNLNESREQIDVQAKRYVDDVFIINQNQ